MPATGGSMNLKLAGQKSFMRLLSLQYQNPEAANTSKVVASVDPSTTPAGTSLTLQTAVSGKLLKVARQASVTITDAAFSGPSPLTVVVTLSGYRFGLPQSEDVSLQSTSGAALVVNSAKVYDQFLAPVIKSISNAAAGDSLLVGITGVMFGLPARIKVVGDVKRVFQNAGTVEQAPLAISSTTVDVAASAIKGVVLAAADSWFVEFVANGEDGFSGGGAMA